jgi:hypothetical protein
MKRAADDRAHKKPKANNSRAGRTEFTVSIAEKLSQDRNNARKVHEI